MYKVAAYITAYEDSEAVHRCINAIKQQSYPIETIFIVDNSRKNPIVVSQENIIIEYHPENIGIAGGLEKGVNWAISQGYDFLWTFDQDSEPKADVLEKLINKYQQLIEEGSSIGIIAPLPVDVDSGLELHGAIFQEYKRVLPPGYEWAPEHYECDIVITSGSLVNLAAAKNVELPTKDLFIDGIDWLYCMNFRQKGYSVVVLKTAIMQHHLGSSQWYESPIRRRKILVYQYSPLRYYYMCRNHTFAETRLANKSKLHKVAVRRLQAMGEFINHLLLYESDLKFTKIWACLRGTIDGFQGNLGKTW
jgi:rhamnosyltransferase